jgi:hypothetical protein
VSCDLTSNKNSNWNMQCICTMSVLSEYYTVKVLIVKCNLAIKLKNHSFPDICLFKFFYLF